MIALALLMAAGVVTAWAVAHETRAAACGRAGAPFGRRVVRPPSLPGVGWPWWPLAAGAIGWQMGGPVTAALGAAGAAVACSSARRRRLTRVSVQLDEQLADSVRSLAAGMRAGLSVQQAIEHVSREGEPPLALAWRRVVDTVDVGGTLDEALTHWAAEVGTDDAGLVAGVLDLHRRSGGDLPRVLDQAATTLRERTEAAREVRALTAQARLSGAILGLLPIGFFAFLWLTSRDDIAGAFRSPIGLSSIAVGLTLEGGAFLWIRRLLEVA